MDRVSGRLSTVKKKQPKTQKRFFLFLGVLYEGYPVKLYINGKLALKRIFLAFQNKKNLRDCAL